MFAELHLPELHNEEEFDRELFEPTHDGWDGDEDAIDAGHGLQNENLYDDGVIHQHAQGTVTTIYKPGYKSSFTLACLYIK